MAAPSGCVRDGPPAVARRSRRFIYPSRVTFNRPAVDDSGMVGNVTGTCLRMPGAARSALTLLFPAGRRHGSTRTFSGRTQLSHRKKTIGWHRSCVKPTIDVFDSCYQLHSIHKCVTSSVERHSCDALKPESFPNSEPRGRFLDGFKMLNIFAGRFR